MTLDCQWCGRALRPGARFCPSCGPALDAPRPAPRTVFSAANRQWRALLGAIILFGLMLFSSFASVLAIRITKSQLPILGAETFDAVAAVAFAVQARGEIATLLKLHGIKLMRLLEIIAVTCAAAVILTLYFRILEAWGVPVDSTEPTYVKSAWNLWVVVAAVSVMPPIFEELAFRGIIQTRLEMVLKPTEAVVVQAAVFAVLHLSPVIFASHFMMGLYLGYLRRRTGSLYPGMLAHAAWNTSVLAGELLWFR